MFGRVRQRWGLAVVTGAASGGQGVETAMAQIASDVLGVPHTGLLADEMPAPALIFAAPNIYLFRRQRRGLPPAIDFEEAEKFGIEEIIDPRTTRSVLTRWAKLARRVLDTEPARFWYRP